jgi:outer membrane protein TolC
MTMRALSLALVLAATTACSMTPKLTLPAAPVSPAYPLAPDLAPDGEAVPEWRAMFGDPRLQRLIALALDDNRDLRIAALNAETARAQIRVTRAQGLPEINLEGTSIHQRQPGSVAGRGWASTIRHRLSRSASSPRRRR